MTVVYLCQRGSATAINDRGVIVGSSTTTPEGTVPHAVLWTRSTGST